MPVKRLALLFLLISPAWGQFAWKAQLTYDHTKAGTNDTTNFVALVYASNASLKLTGAGGKVQSSAGADILFFTDSTLGTQVPSQIDYYDSTNGILWAKALVSDLSVSTNGSIYIGVGNASPPARTTAGLWDSNYKGVWNFKNGTTLDLTDATGNGNNGAVNNSPTAATGQVDGAATLTRGAGFDNDVTIPYSSSLNITGKLITLECWIKRTISTAYGDIFYGPYGSNQGYFFQLNASTTSSFELGVRGVAGPTFGAMAQDTNWHHVVLVSDSSHVTAWVDGQTSAGVGTSSSILSASSGTASIGPASGPASNGYTLDEVRLSATNRASSANYSYVTANYNNQLTPGNIGSAGFWTWGSWQSNSDFTCSGPSGGYDLQASSTFTCTKSGGTWSTGNTVTIADGSQGGTIAPSVGSPGTSTVTFAPGNGASSFTYTYTPVAVATISLSYSNNYSGTNPSPNAYAVSALVLSFSGCPSSGYATLASTTCTVSLTGGTFNGSMTVTAADGSHGGTVTPSVGSAGTAPLTVTPTAASSSFTFTYTPVSVGSMTISLSNNFNGTNPSSFGYTSNASTLAFSGCSSGNLRVASSTCTVTITGATFDGVHGGVLSDGANFGTFVSGSSGNPLTVIPTNGASSFTYTYNPYLVGQKLITFTPGTSNWGAPTPFLYTSSSTDASTFTAKAGTDATPALWASAGTWNCTSGGCGHTAPDTGDTVIIGSYHVKIPASTVGYIGTCPANNTTYDLQISDNGTTSGTLEVAGKLWLCGNVSLAAGTDSLGDNPATWPILQLDTGAELDWDINQSTSVAYRAVSANDYGWGKLYSGVSTDACNFAAGTCPTNIKGVNLAASGAVNPDLYEATVQDALVYRIYGTGISDCGGAAKGCLEYKTTNIASVNNYSDAGVIDLRNNIFRRTGTFQAPVGGLYGPIPRPNFVENRFLADLAGVQSLDPGAVLSSGNCYYTDNYFSGVFGAANEALAGCSFKGNVWAVSYAMPGTDAYPFAAYSDNVIEAGQDQSMNAPVASRNIWMKATLGYPNTLHMMAGPPTLNWSLTDNLCLALGAQYEGHCINGVNGVVGATWKMLNNISLPATGNQENSGQFFVYLTQTGPLLYADHNATYGTGVYTWFASVGHTTFFPTGTVFQSYRANVHWAPSAGAQNLALGYSAITPSSAPGNSVNTANLGWNAFYQSAAAASFGAGVNSNCNAGGAGSAYLGTPYDICEASKANPDNTLNDLLNTDPKVIDNTRNPLTWAQRVHGQAAATVAAMDAVFMACQSEIWCVEEARTWTARGFQPTNLALKGKAHDGRIVGFTGSYGSGYSGSCTVAFTPQDVADLGTGAAATCAFNGAGTPVIQITNPGQNYRIATPATVAIGGTCTGGCVAASLAPVISPHDIGPVQMALIPGAM